MKRGRLTAAENRYRYWSLYQSLIIAFVWAVLLPFVLMLPGSHFAVSTTLNNISMSKNKQLVHHFSRQLLLVLDSIESGLENLGRMASEDLLPDDVWEAYLMAYPEEKLPRTRDLLLRTEDIQDFLKEPLEGLQEASHIVSRSLRRTAELVGLIPNPGPFSQIIGNLVINSVEYGFSGRSEGTVSIHVYRHEDSVDMRPGHACCLRSCDSAVSRVG